MREARGQKHQVARHDNKLVKRCEAADRSAIGGVLNFLANRPILYPCQLHNEGMSFISVQAKAAVWSRRIDPKVNRTAPAGLSTQVRELFPEHRKSPLERPNAKERLIIEMPRDLAVDGRGWTSAVNDHGPAEKLVHPSFRIDDRLVLKGTGH